MTAHSVSCASRIGGRRAAGWHRVSSVLIYVVSLCYTVEAIAADPASISLVPVKASQPDTWPEGDWIPIRDRVLKDLVERSRPQPDRPRHVWIERATYSAVFDGESLRGGRLSADVRHDDKLGRLLSLEPLNLAVSKMSWVDQPAIWGTLRNGRSALFVDGKHSTLVGTWSLTGRRLPRSVEFDIQVPSAAVNRIRLIVREGDVVSTSAGEGRWIELEGQTGLRQWELDLGSQTQCRLKIRERPEQTNVTPLVLSESTHSYIVREDGVQLQAEFLLEAANAPVNLFLFKIPAGIDIYSVNYGSNSSPAWRIIRNADERLLAVQLADELSGVSRPIRIDGTATTTLGRSWQIPQPQLLRALNTSSQLRTMRDEELRGAGAQPFVNTAFLRGDLHLKVEAPLELQTVNSLGLRQTATVSTPDVSRSLSFQQYVPNANLTLRVGLPELRRRANLLSYVDISAENWSITSHVTMATNAGQTFDAKFLLAPHWEVIEVRPRDDVSTWTDWDVRREKGGGRTLTIEFRDAIAPGMPKSVEVVARRLPLSKLRPLRLPFLQPLNHRSAQQVIAIPRAAISVDPPDVLSGFRSVSVENPPEFVVGSELWQRIESASEGELELFRSDDVRAEGELQPGQSGPISAAEVWTTERIDSDSIHERFELRLRPKSEAMDVVKIYLSVAAGDVAWNLDGDVAESLTAIRLPPGRHRDWKLPSSGELWEIQLPQTFRREINLVGTRMRSRSSSVMATLATIPDADPFHGFVELQLADGVHVDVQAEGLAASQPGTVASEAGWIEKQRRAIGRVWGYQSPRGSMQLRLLEEAGDLELQQSAVLKLRSILSEEFPGFDRHRATLTLPGSRKRGEIRFELPRPAVLLSTMLDGKLVTPYRRDDEWVVAHAGEGDSTSIQIEYQSSTTAGRFIHTGAIPLPKCAYTILDFQWEFATPPDTWIVREPSGMVLNKRLPQLSWTERFFGPLGRPVERAMFNPFSLRSWSALRGVKPEVISDKADGAAERFFPAGWDVNRAHSLFVPDRLTISTRRHSQAWLLAWVGTLGCLLFGLLMRFRQSEFRKSVFGYWLSMCLFAAWLSPPFYALIAGGCVVGTVVALLLPRRLLERLHFEKKTSDVVPAGSTASIRQSPVATVLLISALSAAQSLAQPSPEIDAKQPNSPTRAAVKSVSDLHFPIRVLSPGMKSTSIVADEDVVYVESSVLKRLRQEAGRRDSAAEFVITAANYSATVDAGNAAVVTADYVVYLLPGVRAARVAFPNALANPGQCRVNGKPHAIVLGDDGREFFVDLVSSAKEPPDGGLLKYEISLELRPATQAIASGFRYRLNTVAVASARLQQEFAKPLETIEINGNFGEHDVAMDRRSVTSFLGMSQQFEINWSENSEPGRVVARLEAEVASYVMVRPTWLKKRYRIHYRILSGQVDFVALRLPLAAEKSLVRSVTLDGTPVESVFKTAVGENTSRLLIEFAESQKSDFVVEAVMVQPIASSDRAVITLAAATIVDETAQPYEVTQTRHLFAVAAPQEFDVSTPESDELESGIREIDIETYDSVIGEEQAARPVRSAFELFRESSELPVTLTPVSPVRNVRLRQTATFRPEVLEWALSADLETSSAPVFRHRLRVPVELSITEISVREDNAERLVHWSRQGSVVELFLSDKSNGRQSLLLKGESRLSRVMPMALPLIEIEQAKLSSTRLRVLRDRHVTVQLVDAESLEVMDNGIAAIVEGEELEAVGQYRVLSDDKQVRVRVVPRSDPMQVKCAVRVAPLAPHQFEIVYRYQFSSGDDRRPVEPIRIRIPSVIADGIHIEPTDVVATRDLHADGSVELQIAPKIVNSPMLALRVAAVVDEPAPGDWSLPQPELNDVDNHREQYLLISEDVGLQPVGRNIKIVPRQTVPIWVNPLAEVDSGDDTWGVYQIESDEVSFFVGLSESEPKASQIPLVESQITHSGDDAIFGRTTLWIAHLDDHEIAIEWPRHLVQRACFVDGVPSVVRPRDPQSNRVSIPVASGRGPHRVDIHWSQTIGTTTSRWTPQQIILPMPRGIAVRRNIVKLVPPGDMFYSARDPLERTDEWDHSLDRLQSLFELNQSQVTGVRNRSLWQAMQNQRTILLERLDGTAARSNDAKYLERFSRTSSAIEELETEVSSNSPPNQLTEPMAKHTAPTVAVELAAPNRNSLWGRVEGVPVDSRRTISYWAFGNWVVAVVLLLLGLPFIPLIRRMVRMEIGPWLFRHQPVAWALLGLLWWTCLRPSEVGVVLLLVSLCLVVWEWRRARRETDFSVDISTDESENVATMSP